eukprot:scaffold1399_cov410-Prasinococcus_capsulatus_cf.AAC.23
MHVRGGVTASYYHVGCTEASGCCWRYPGRFFRAHTHGPASPSVLPIGQDGGLLGGFRAWYRYAPHLPGGF